MLHIGTEKTGTTTLQHFFDVNRAALIEKGYFVPKSLAPHSGLANHERLTTYALRNEKLDDDLRVSAGIRSAEHVERHRANVERDLREEVASIASDVATLLLSNEHCHSRLVEPDEVTRLKEFLNSFADTFEVIIYIRPQHELATSLYDQALKVGYFDIDVLPFADTARKLWVDRRYFEYDSLVNLWSTVFGDDNLKVRLFDRRRLLNQNIVSDFLRLVGITPNGMYHVADQNRSIGSTLQHALNAINRFENQNPGSIGPELREKLITVFGQDALEASIKPARKDAMRFLQQFDEGNEYVRQKFFPERTNLFDPDFSLLPSEQSPRVPDQEALVKALVHILTTGTSHHAS